jgi:hypothetical protein
MYPIRGEQIMDKFKVRFGIRINAFFFKNAGIFVFPISESNWVKLQEAVTTIRAILPEEYQEMLVCEKRI